jgi:hypothetical protein
VDATKHMPEGVDSVLAIRPAFPTPSMKRVQVDEFRAESKEGIAKARQSIEDLKPNWLKEWLKKSSEGV